MVWCLHTSKLQAAASALLMGDLLSLLGPCAYTGWRTVVMWIQTALSGPMVSVWAYGFRDVCPENKAPCKASGIWGFVHLRLCLVSDVEVAFQLVCIRMWPLGAENSNKASGWEETSKDGFVSGVFSVCSSKANRHLVTSRCFCVFA